MFIIFVFIFAALAILALFLKSFGIFVFSVICCAICAAVWKKSRDLKRTPPSSGVAQTPQERAPEENAGCPYSSEIKQTSHWGTPLTYSYNDVACTVTGDLKTMRIGSVVYPDHDGVVQNVNHQAVAKLDSRKIAKMIDDYLTRGDTISARVSGIGDKLSINIGFYREPEEDLDDEDDFDDDESEDDDSY